MHFRGLSCSGSQELHKGTDSFGHPFCALPRSEQLRQPGAWRGHCPRWAVRLTTSPVPAARFPWYAMGVPSQLCISSGELTSGCNLLAGVNRPGSQVDVVSSWGAAHSLVEDAVSGAETGAAPCLPALVLACLPLPWQGVGGGLYAAGSLSFDILLVLCSVSGPGYM